jgi:TRAP-type uncharacterized transport system substrate-binding protein
MTLRLSPSVVHAAGRVGFVAATALAAAGVMLYALWPTFARVSMQRLWEPISGPPELTMATGFANTGLHAMGKVLGTQLEEDHRFKMNVVDTDGSPVNAPMLRARKADIGFVSSVVQIDLSELEGLATVERQYLHFIVPQASPIRRLRDLATRPGGKNVRLSLGPVNGAPDVIGRQLLEYYKATAGVTILNSSDQQLKRNLLTDFELGHFDAAMRISLLHSSNVEAPLGTGQYRLVPIEDAEALAKFLPGMEPIVIPEGTYQASPDVSEGDRAAVKTLAAQVALVARPGLPAFTAQRVLQTLYGHEFAKKAHVAGLSEESGQRVIGVPLHAAAEAYYRRNEPITADRFEIASFALTLFGLAWAALRVSRRFDRGDDSKRAVVTTSVERFAAISEAAEQAVDVASLEALFADATKINRDSIKRAAEAALRPSDLAVMRQAYDECSKTIRRRKRTIENAPRTEIERSEEASG